MLRAYFCRTFVIGKKIMDFRSAVEIQMRGNDMSVLSEKLSHGVALVAVSATDHLAQQPFDLGPIFQTDPYVSHALLPRSVLRVAGRPCSPSIGGPGFAHIDRLFRADRSPFPRLRLQTRRYDAALDIREPLLVELIELRADLGAGGITAAFGGIHFHIERRSLIVHRSLT